MHTLSKIFRYTLYVILVLITLISAFAQTGVPTAETITFIELVSVFLGLFFGWVFILFLRIPAGFVFWSVIAGFVTLVLAIDSSTPLKYLLLFLALFQVYAGIVFSGVGR